MAIHPGYANAILDGRKTVEFRKRGLAPDVRTVVIYATSPEKRIVGEFTVDSVTVAAPAELWSTAGSQGCIARADFDAYYAASGSAAGIGVANARRYRVPVPLSELDPTPAVPQSYTYLSIEVHEQLGQLQEQQPRSTLARMAVTTASAVRATLGAPRCNPA